MNIILFMESLIRKISLYLAAALLLFMHFALEAPLPAGGVFRLHILANSDTAADQRVKMLVRDAVLDWAREAQARASLESPGALKALLLEGAEAESLQSAVEGVLQNSGADYGARLAMGTYAFPDRDYGGLSYPAGDYQALRVVLGEGNGHNWWCVMFPPLCILELPSGEIEYEGDAVKFSSLFLNWLKGVNKDLWEKLVKSWR